MDGSRVVAHEEFGRPGISFPLEEPFVNQGEQSFAPCGCSKRVDLECGEVVGGGGSEVLGIRPELIRRHRVRRLV